MEYYSAINKERNIAMCSKWMDLENIILSEISQTEKEEYYMMSLVYGIEKIIQMNLFTKQQQTHRHSKQTWLPKEKVRGEKDKLGV